MTKPRIIKCHKGVLYFPSLLAARMYAAHLGLTAARFSPSLHGWFIKTQ